jgi:hypothetical protein
MLKVSIASISQRRYRFPHTNIRRRAKRRATPLHRLLCQRDPNMRTVSSMLIIRHLIVGTKYVKGIHRFDTC